MLESEHGKLILMSLCFKIFYLRQMMIIYEGVELEAPEEILLGNPSVNYTKQIEQK